MISTYLGYQLFGQNLARTEKQTAAGPAVSAAKKYFDANIGHVKSVSDLVNNNRLLAYVTQAFGLGNMAHAKGLLTQVLESNTSDPKSVASKLGGNYLAMAQAFNFNGKGTVVPLTQAQTSAQQAATEATFNATTNLSSKAAHTATSNYATAINSITSLHDLESNSTTLGYALAAYGINASTAASTFEQTLESNLADPNSFINKQANSGYMALWQGFTVNADGTAAAVPLAETQANVSATVAAFLSHVGTAASAQATGASATAYFLSKIGGITTAKQLVADPQIVAYLEAAYQLPRNTTPADIFKAVTSDLTNKSSFAASSPFPGFLQMAKAMNFGTDGNAKTVHQVQSAAQQQSTINLYMEHQSSDTTAADLAVSYYKAHIGSVTSVSQLEQDPQLLKFIETAYGITASTSNTTLQSIIENTNGIATNSPNAGLLAFNQAYNVDANGNMTAPYAAQSAANISATTAAYLANAGKSTTALAAAKAATGYYEANIANVSSVDSLLNDPKLVAYVEAAYGIPTHTSTTVLREILTSNLSDQSSVANSMGNNYAQLAGAFNFSSAGTIAKESGSLQSRAQTLTVNQHYLDQQIETNANNGSPGIALALYFQFQASKIHSAFDILADPKLVTIFQTMMGQSSSASKASIDVQAALINKSFDLTKLSDPTYLKHLIQRFSIMYDLHPPPPNHPRTTTSVLSGSTDPVSQATLFGSQKKTTAELLFGSKKTNSTSQSSTTPRTPTSILFGG